MHSTLTILISAITVISVLTGISVSAYKYEDGFETSFRHSEAMSEIQKKIDDFREKVNSNPAQPNPEDTNSESRSVSEQTSTQNGITVSQRTECITKNNSTTCVTDTTPKSSQTQSEPKVEVSEQNVLVNNPSQKTEEMKNRIEVLTKELEAKRQEMSLCMNHNV